MKLKFKVQPYQTHAVDSLADCFAGQPKSSGMSYRINPGAKPAAQVTPRQARLAGMEPAPPPATWARPASIAVPARSNQPGATVARP